MNRPAPVALFAYNRLWHIQQTLEALQKNEQASESELYIFCDESRTEADADKVQSVRNFVKAVSGFKKFNIIERDKNFGLARSVISGVTEIVNKFGRVIVLEDDMVTSPYFLRYMNEALDYYKDEERVISIHGYIYPVKAKLPDTFFLRGADCWGWATWKRGWDLFESDGQKLLDEIKKKKLGNSFDINGAYPYTRMLEDQVIGHNDSWAIRWYASAFLQNRLTLYPGKSLVHNIGIDKSGMHCSKTDIYDTNISLESIPITTIPVIENESVKKEIERYFKSINPGFLKRIKDLTLKARLN